MPLVRRIVALVMAGLLGGLTPAAYADPPDPTWLDGYFAALQTLAFPRAPPTRASSNS